MALSENIKTIVERLIGSVSVEDVCSPEEITQAEEVLGSKLPTILKNLYLYAGRNKTLMTSFNEFALPDQLYISEEKVVFLLENQGVCVWGFDRFGDDPIVYQQPHGDNKWYSEEVTLSEFLTIILYNQCAEEGYKYIGLLGIDCEKMTDILDPEWEKVVHHNGLCIWWKQGCLVWYFYEQDNIVDDCVYLSAKTKRSYIEYEKQFNLMEL